MLITIELRVRKLCIVIYDASDKEIAGSFIKVTELD